MCVVDDSSCVVSVTRTGNSYRTCKALNKYDKPSLQARAHRNAVWVARWRPKREASSGGRHVAAFGFITAKDDDSLPDVSAVMMLV